MADFIAPVVDWLVGVLKETDFSPLENFAAVETAWTGIVEAWPTAAVMGRSSEFDPEVMGASHSSNAITIKFGVSDSDPNGLTHLAWRYMKAIDDAIQSATPPVQVTHVHVAQHDYGPLFGAGQGGGFARFPEMHLDIEVYEALSAGEPS